jgi:hypothetical protein
MVGSDGGIFNFSDRPFLGSLGDEPPPVPLVAALAHPGDSGYWMLDADGRVYPFGDAGDFGSSHTVLSEGGQAAFRFSSLVPGTTRVVAGIGHRRSAWAGGSEPLAQTWTAGPPAGITVSAERPEARPGESVTVTADVTDAVGYPVPDGTAVTFQATGTGGETIGGADSTTRDGIAVMTFTSSRPGRTTVTASAGPAVGTADILWHREGYWMIGADGAVYPFGDAVGYEGPGGAVPGTAVDLEPTPSGQGYWIVDDQGKVSPPASR